MRIDINADLGEGLDNDASLMPFLSSCNIACGGHAGNIQTMHQTVRLAKKYSVKIGAHPSYPDLKNFGRKKMDIASAQLYAVLKKQIRNLMAVLHKENADLHHIKPHGALYNTAAVDEKTAQVIIEVIKSIAHPVKLYVPYNSVIEKLAIKEQIPILYEVFADRNYNDDLTLVSRTNTKALILDADQMFNHVYGMITTQKVTTINGLEIPIMADTYCIHGDHPKAEMLLKALTKRLTQHHIQIV